LFKFFSTVSIDTKRSIFFIWVPGLYNNSCHHFISYLIVFFIECYINPVTRIPTTWFTLLIFNIFINKKPIRKLSTFLNSDTTSKISFFFICIINKVSIHHSSASTSVIQFTVFLKHAITDLFHSSQSFTWEIIRFNFRKVFITPRRSKFKLKRVDKSTYNYLHPYNIHTK